MSHRFSLGLEQVRLALHFHMFGCQLVIELYQLYMRPPYVLVKNEIVVHQLEINT